MRLHTVPLTDTTVKNAKPGLKPDKDKDGKNIFVVVNGPYSLADGRGLSLLSSTDRW
jgi:hypothetical protein